MQQKAVGGADREGARARKRRETLQRVVDAGVCLFIEKGVDATTVDEIAAAAGISRRTFFHHFKSKDDILLSLQAGLGELIAGHVRHAAADVRPLHAIRDAVVAVCATIPAEDMIRIDGLMRSSPAVQARKQASYVEHERLLLDAMKERWPERTDLALKMVAMLAIGAIRIATDTLSREGGERPMSQLLADVFGVIEIELATPLDP